MFSVFWSLTNIFFIICVHFTIIMNSIAYCRRLLPILVQGYRQKTFMSSWSTLQTRNLSSKEGGEKESDAASEEGQQNAQTAEEITLQSTQILEGLGQNIVGSLRRPKAADTKKSKDRRIPIPWQTSIRYMESKAYKEAYGDYLIWQLFRRNFPGQFWNIPANTRVSCVGDDGFIKYGQACPICRDEYLVLHYKNVKLLKQFINPFTGKVLPPNKTNLCQVKHEELLITLLQAKDYGTMSFHIPFREYDYRDYYRAEELKGLKIEEGFDDSQDPVLQKALQDPDFGGHHEYARESFPNSLTDFYPDDTNRS